VGEHLQYCKPIKEAVSDQNSIWSWKPVDAEWIYLIKIHGYTLAYVPMKDELYFVSPQYNLKPSCPNLTIFLCQCLRDPDSSSRILVLDLLCENNSEMKSMSAPERYNRLRFYEEHFLKPNITIQWCGNKEALNEFFFETLPHKVDGIFALTAISGSMEASLCISFLLISCSSINS
jgi:hypothetical protein